MNWKDRTVCNRRWWAVFPLMVVIMPFAFGIYGLTAAYEWFHFKVSNRVVGLLRKVNRWQVLQPLVAWTHGGKQ